MVRIQLEDEEDDLIVESVEIHSEWVVGKKTDAKTDNNRYIPISRVEQMIEMDDEEGSVQFN